MNHCDIKIQLQNIFSKLLHYNISSLNESDNNHSIRGWDSAFHVELISDIETMFSISISFIEASWCQNIGDLIRLIEFKLNNTQDQNETVNT